MTDSKGSKQQLIMQQEQLREAEVLRRAAFAATSCSIIASVISVVLIPMLYSYVQYVQIKLEDELVFCRSQSRLLGEEWILLRNENDLEVPAERFKRDNFSALPERLKQAIYVGQHNPQEGRPKRQTYQPSSSVSPPGIKPITSEQIYGASNGEGSCCSCGVGKPGPNGPPGGDGNNGKDGFPGPDGDSGLDAPPAKKVTSDDFCFDCPPGAVGPAGRPGPKGTPGNDGSNGINGVNGKPGAVGQLGHPGTAGQQGQVGQKGSSGEPGQLVEVPGIPGSVGPPGRMGHPGIAGKAGLTGRPGRFGVEGPRGNAGPVGPNGQPGGNGNKGEDGLAGALGGCGHCPPPRTAPGF